MREILPLIAPGANAKKERKSRMKGDAALEAEITRSVNLLAKDGQRRRQAQLDAERAAALWANNGACWPQPAQTGQLIPLYDLLARGLDKARQDQERTRGEGTEEYDSSRNTRKIPRFVDVCRLY